MLLGLFDEGVDFEYLFDRHASALALVPKNLAQLLEVIQVQGVMLRPIVFRLEPGLESPLGTLSNRGDVSHISIRRFLTPFVLLHSRWSEADSVGRQVWVNGLRLGGGGSRSAYSLIRSVAAR